MMTHVEKLFTVESFHEYYKSMNGTYLSPGADIEFVPSEVCQQNLKKQRLLFTRSPGGFTVVFTAGKIINDIPHLLIPIDQRVSFSFYLKQKNPYLLNYSNLPLDKCRGYVYYINNLGTNLQVVNDISENLLTRDTVEPWLSDQDLLPLHTGSIKITGTSLKTHILLKVINEFSELIIEKQIKPINNAYDYIIDPTPLVPGGYSIYIDDELRESFYYDPELKGNNVFGILTIFAGPDIPDEYRFVNNDMSVNEKTFRIRINNRKTLWKYLVGLKYKKDLEPATLSISCSDPIFDFVKEDHILMGENIKTLPFISTGRLFPLRKEPLKGIRLQKVSSESGNAFTIDNLPNPSVKNICIHEENECSEIFIYI